MKACDEYGEDVHDNNTHELSDHRCTARCDGHVSSMYLSDPLAHDMRSSRWNMFATSPASTSFPR